MPRLGRFIPFLAAAALVAAASGCSNARTYRIASPELGGAVVETRVRIGDGVASARTGAGDYRVLATRLVTRTGAVLPPDRARALPDAWVGGTTVGLGVGFGTGYRGSSSGATVGVGGSRPVGGRILPGALVAEWDAPPVDLQPWTLVAQVETTRDAPPVEARIVLATLLDSTPVDGEPGVTIDRLRLPDGRTVAYRVETTGGGARRMVPVAE